MLDIINQLGRHLLWEIAFILATHNNPSCLFLRLSFSMGYDLEITGEKFRAITWCNEEDERLNHMYDVRCYLSDLGDLSPAGGEHL
jgi:hypothetical protein